MKKLILISVATIWTIGSIVCCSNQSQNQTQLSLHTDDTAGLQVIRLLDGRQTEDALPEICLSPDGMNLAYISSSNGGLYVRETSSGIVRQVVPGQPDFFNHSPVWSPDGKHIAFSCENMDPWAVSVKIVNLQSKKITTVIGPTNDRYIEVNEWSRNNQYLLCHYYPYLALVKIDDGTITILSDSLELKRGSLSHDNRFVTFAYGDGQNSQIFVQSVSGGPSKQITFTSGGNCNPLWSPDGQSIIYQSRFGIWKIPLINGEPIANPQLVTSVTNLMLRNWTEKGLVYSQFTDAGQRTVPYFVRMDPGSGRSIPESFQVLSSYLPDSISVFAWSPDMQRIIIGHRMSPNITITSLEPKSFETLNLGRNGHVRRPIWSADGRMIYYEPDAQYQSNQGVTILALDVSTGFVREMFPRTRNIGGFSLSDDLKKVAFLRYSEKRGDNSSIWPSAGSFVEALEVAITGQFVGKVVATIKDSCLTPFSGYLRPMLSADGNQVLYVRQSPINDPSLACPNSASLWVVNSDGNNARKLVTAAFIQSAIWDPSGKFIAYTAKPEIPDEVTVLRIIEVDSRKETEIFLPLFIGIKPGVFEFIRAVHWSNDGRFLGFIIGHDLDPGWELWMLIGLN